MGYFGSKTASGAFQAVIAQMPPHDLYIETHAGSGAVWRAKPAAPRTILIEIDVDALTALKAGNRVHRVVYMHGDCLEALAALDLASMGRVLIYADPPYVLASRTSSKRYRHDYTDDDHRALIEFFSTLPPNVAVILSGYPSALYDELLSDWRMVEFQVMTRGGPRTERLWMNFPAGAVDWVTFAGKNKDHRQRIKRRAASWAGKYRRLGPEARLAVLAALLKEHSRDPVQSKPTAIDRQRRRRQLKPTPLEVAIASSSNAGDGS